MNDLFFYFSFFGKYDNMNLMLTFALTRSFVNFFPSCFFFVKKCQHQVISLLDRLTAFFKKRVSILTAAFQKKKSLHTK